MYRLILSVINRTKLLVLRNSNAHSNRIAYFNEQYNPLAKLDVIPRHMNQQQLLFGKSDLLNELGTGVGSVGSGCNIRRLE
ncbi:hypothetical protein SAMD00019534_001700, partial [Acytostelium subglobosum LB1]|uniref:hypothetical protein n=1 Tax=Acytostelium subglobosum LB1 TaxID=1410327 RepID=UPI000644A817